MPMKILLFDNAAVAAEVKALGIAVMLQSIGGKPKYAVTDTPEVRAVINKMKGQFDWGQILTSNQLCF